MTQILVVDDSRLQRRLLTGSLTRWGYEVTEAASGEEALELCANRLPDLILSDWTVSYTHLTLPTNREV